jgi:hypothetical protein
LKSYFSKHAIGQSQVGAGSGKIRVDPDGVFKLSSGALGRMHCLEMANHTVSGLVNRMVRKNANASTNIQKIA